MTPRAQRNGGEAGFTLVEILVVITIIAALIGVVAAIIPQAQQASRKVQCSNNLHNIGGMLVQRQTGKGLGTRGGSAMLLNTYKLGMIRKGDEKVFICPGDKMTRSQDPESPDFLKRYENIDLDNIDPLIISYAGRNRKNYPIRADSREKQAWACDCQGDDGRTGHHPGGLNVLYDDASVVFLDTEALGLGIDDPIVIGPDSTVEVLKQFIVRE
ncbi:MAG: prepilin-type N-terminal cleavage/methylation domain-containing protein [Planctomycetes bacterium]|nr:prepilin-type N-terminal cleavage/methylation domain-containing protein [Planctomycetota bacterium]